MIHLTRITQYIEAIVFALYCVLLMITVLTFKPGMIRFQLGQLMWTIVTVGIYDQNFQNISYKCVYVSTCITYIIQSISTLPSI